MDDQYKIKWTLYITLTLLFVFISLSEIGLFSPKKSLLLSQNHPHSLDQKYVIIYDAGSTGTRVHVFTFIKNSEGQITLGNEHFGEVKIGLSSFADNPSNAAKIVLHLLNEAKQFIPAHRWSETPVALKATAGLRLLPNAVSNSILEEVSEAFKNSPFPYDDNSVTILAGEDEGVYAWFTLNFLLGRLTDVHRSVATLDLGGGSTQITFSPSEFDTLLTSPKDNIVLTKIQNKSMTLYTRSYLGLGLMSARQSILQLSSDYSGNKDNNSITTFTSSCISPHDQVIWKHDLKEYLVMGRKSGKYGFKPCYNKATRFLGNTVHRPEELNRREIYVLSYYYDRALDMGIVSKGGKFLQVNDFLNACKNVCALEKPKEIFLCLDCSYITALLHHGFGIEGKNEIRFTKGLNGIETSWGLGAAFNMLL